MINAGKGDGLYPNNLIELINTNSPGKRIRIGDITLGKNDGMFEVDTEYAQFLAESLSQAEFKGSELSVKIAKGESTVVANERRSFKDKGKLNFEKDYKKGRPFGDKKGKDFPDKKGKVFSDKKSKDFPDKKGKDFPDKKGRDFADTKDQEIKSWIKSKGENPFSGSDEWAGKKKKKKK